MLELAGRSEPEVAGGRASPLCRPLVTAPETHGPEGIGRAKLPAPASSPSDRPAHSLIIETARERPGELTLVALGPLGNVADAVLAEPELPRLLRQLVIMGGNFSNTDEPASTGDRNTAVDPEAAAIVYRKFGRDGAPLPLVVGLGVTRGATILPADLEALRGRTGDTPIARFTEQALGFRFDYNEANEGFRGAFAHDSFALDAVLDPGLVETKRVPLAVETGDDSGASPRLIVNPDDEAGSYAEVAANGDGARHVERLMNSLARLAA